MLRIRMSSISIYPLPYVYKIVDKESGSFYIGSRRGNIILGLEPENDILKTYFTSGRLKKRIFESPQNFEAIILFKHEDYDVVYWYEQLLIKESIENSLCENAHYIDPDSDKKIFTMAGKKQTKEHIEKRMSQLRGKPAKKHSDETKTKLSKPRTLESRIKQSQTNKGRIHTTVTCPYCGKSGGKPSMKQWHFTNCKNYH